MITYYKKFFILFLIFAYAVLPLKTFAYGSLFDGGELQGQDSQCSCSGGQTIKIMSYVDHSQHVYLYQPGVTQLYANYNILSTNGYFLTTLVPLAYCFDASEECEGSSGQQPEGIFLMVGTSWNESKDNLFSMLKDVPGISSWSRNILGIVGEISPPNFGYQTTGLFSNLPPSPSHPDLI
jgi:hypothetical protein